MTARVRQPGHRVPRLRTWPRRLSLVLLCVGWGCAGPGLGEHADTPEWLNSVLTAQAPVTMTPTMSVADRLTELRRAKEAAHQQLMNEVLALRVKDQGTIAELSAAHPQLRKEIESYVDRVAVVDVDQSSGTAEVRARVELGADLLDLLHIKNTRPPADRNTPSTGIVHPLS
ncbi:MAG TPA: hypothetical protein VLY45_01875 [Nitrospiria bacterium]|nr:hypothetical protein [Nitrospiria bacterium]